MVWIGVTSWPVLEASVALMLAKRSCEAGRPAVRRALAGTVMLMGATWEGILMCMYVYVVCMEVDRCGSGSGMWC